MRVLGIVGSLREGSHNHALLREAAERLPAGAELVEFERLGEIPPYDADLEGLEVPEPVRALREAIRGADGVLVVTPEYNHSIPGVLKNALDWASRPAGRSAMNGKPALVVGASPGMFGGRPKRSTTSRYSPGGTPTNVKRPSVSEMVVAVARSGSAPSARDSRGSR